MVKTLVRNHRSEGVRVSPAALAAAAICDQHGAALQALAGALIDDLGSSGAAVVDVIAVAFPSESMAVPMPVAEMRRQLAARLYRRCVSGPFGGIPVLDRERAVVALAQHGQLSYGAVGELVGVQAAEVAQLMNSALRRVSGQPATPSTVR